MLPSNEELVKKTQAGDSEAFAVIYQRYCGKILGYICKYIGDYQKAEDLTNKVFMNAYSSIGMYKEEGAFEAWLYRIATNCAKRELHNIAVRKEVSFEKQLGKEGLEASICLGDLIKDDRNRPDRNAEKKELKEILYRAILRLKTKYREVLLLCDMEELPYATVARILKTSKVSVGVRLMRARNLLRKSLHKFINEL